MGKYHENTNKNTQIPQAIHQSVPAENSKSWNVFLGGCPQVLDSNVSGEKMYPKQKCLIAEMT